eukprot:TRINITY_DN5202_c0_g1_i12.p1 TRINITY_DN5202_c0_g1~~TRINITY_DN5202_c0_g1_i12.p1  ORF type:complete len:422 (-),score=80.18 TRINITY_DN5202_c0_g1_i12:311-1576(-)
MRKFKDLYRKLKRIFNKKTLAAVAALAVSLYYLNKVIAAKIPEVKLSYFLLGLSQNIIAEVVVTGPKVMFRSVNSDKWYFTNAEMLTKDRLYKIIKDKPNLVFSCENDANKTNNIQLAALAACYFMGYKLYSLYSDQFMKKKIDDEYRSQVRFTDIYGLDRAKKELQEIIDFLKNPFKYKNVGARLRRGVLLYGPPGTGKTLLAKATAGESNASFISCTASEFVEMYVGVGPKRVRELFAKARSMSPCIIFIDEIDGIGSRRKTSSQSENGGDSERSSTLNQLLTEMDGFRENDNIVVIAATNRVLLIDDALLRSGRFDTKIKVEMPTLPERVGIMKIHLRNKKHHVENVILENIAKQADGFSGADLENVVNECAYVCVQNNRSNIQNEDVLEAFQKVQEQRNLNMNRIQTPNQVTIYKQE